MTTPTISIGFSPRERYELAAESLSTLLDNTPEPYELIVIAPAIPPRYRAEMDDVLRRRPATEIVEVDRMLLPAASRNLIVERASGDYVALVENDVLYPPGWLEGLVRACAECPADVASPLICEGRGETEHFDHHLGTLIESPPGEPVRIRGIDRPRNSVSERTPVDFVEQHCLLYRRSALEAMGPFDEELNTRDEVDVSMALHAAGQTIVLEPDVRINYVPPSTSPADDELEYFRFRWDLDRAQSSRDRIRDRWNLADTPGDLGFVQYRNHLISLPAMHSVLRDVVAAGGRTILLDNGEWFGTGVTDGLDLVPYTNWQGQFGGFPADGGASLEALDAEIAGGARQLAIAWPAAWWLDHLPELRERLESQATVVRADDRLVVYALERT